MNRNLLLYMDPPQHTKYRQILQSAFVPNTVRRLEDQIRVRVARVVDAAVAKHAFDAVGDLAVPIPLGVLAELMGLPDDDIPRLYEWTEKIEAAQRAPEPAAALDVFVGWRLPPRADRAPDRGERVDSLVMRLRDAEVDGQRLDDTEILVFFGLLVFAGNDTTRNTTANGILALLEHPEQRQLLRDDRRSFRRPSRSSEGQFRRQLLRAHRDV